MPVSLESCVIPFARAASPKTAAITDTSPSSSAALSYAAISSSVSMNSEESHVAAFFISEPPRSFIFRIKLFCFSDVLLLRGLGAADEKRDYLFASSSTPASTSSNTVRATHYDRPACTPTAIRSSRVMFAPFPLIIIARSPFMPAFLVRSYAGNNVHTSSESSCRNVKFLA